MQQSVNLNLILDQVAKDKGIDRPKLIEILEEAIQMAAKRHFGLERNLKAKYDEDRGQIDLFQYMTVVESVAEFMQRVTCIEQARCPHCGIGQFRVVATLLPQRDPPKLRGPP